MSEIVEKAIEYGIWAPSGDNSQPWKFVVKGDELQIFAIPEKDHPILNFKHGGTYIAVGALIENVEITASNFGYKANISFFPNASDPNYVSKINFEKELVPKDPLFEFIKKRHTNRKPYDKNFLTEHEKDEILNSISKFENGKILLVEDSAKRKVIGDSSSILERIALENKELHRLFFKDMIWTEEVNATGKHGLYIKTTELPTPIQKFFKILRHWPITNILNKIGFSRLAAKGNAQVYGSSPTLGIVVVDGFAPINYVETGRMIQRIWLTATKLGLSLQLVTGALFMSQRMLYAGENFLDKKHIHLLKAAFHKISNSFGFSDKENACMMFRLGHSSSASARSYRKKPEVEYLYMGTIKNR